MFDEIMLNKSNKSVKLLISFYINISNEIIEKPQKVFVKSQKKKLEEVDDYIELPKIEKSKRKYEEPQEKIEKQIETGKNRLVIEHTAFNGNARTYDVLYKKKNNNYPLEQLIQTKQSIYNKLVELFGVYKNMKVYEVMKVLFEKDKIDSGGNVVTEYKSGYFGSKTVIISNKDMIFGKLDEINVSLEDRIAKWMGEGSGWTVNSITSHELKVSRYNTCKGGSYIELPKELRNSRKGLINIKNDDDKCFLYCHLYHIYKDEIKSHPECVVKVLLRSNF